MVVQRDERATLLNIPDLDDSIPSANNSDRDGEATSVRRLVARNKPNADVWCFKLGEIIASGLIFELHRWC